MSTPKVKHISGVSKTFTFDEKQLSTYFLALQRGIPEIRALANLLDCPEGVEPLHHIALTLESNERSILIDELRKINPFPGKN